jgi:hypothetical protein
MKTTELISTIILVIAVTIFFTLKSKKEKSSSWKGELIKKKDIIDEDDENHIYRLIFKKDSGKKAKVSVSKEMFNQAQVGDRYEKVAGDYLPKKTS